MPMKEKLELLLAGIPPVLIIFMMSGLFFMGITSLVESSAVGAVSVTLVALFKKRLNWQGFLDVLVETLSVSCMFMWVILAALAFGAVFDGLGAVHAIKNLFLNYGFGKWGIILMMQLSYILMGMFLDDTAMLIIVAPSMCLWLLSLVSVRYGTVFCIQLPVRLPILHLLSDTTCS